MKVEFSKDGFKINSKKIDPLNFNVAGYEVVSNTADYKKDPFEMLQTLASARNDESTKLDKIRALQSMVWK